MIRRPPRSTLSSSSAASDVYKRQRLWRRPVAYGLLALAVLVGLALPVLGMRTGMPSIAVVPKSDPSYIGYQQVQQAFGLGAPGMLQVVGLAGDATTARNVLAADPGIAAVMPAQPSAEGRTVLIQAMPASDPSAKALGTTVEGCGPNGPRQSRSAARPRRTTTWRRRWPP